MTEEFGRWLVRIARGTVQRYGGWLRCPGARDDMESAVLWELLRAARKLPADRTAGRLLHHAARQGAWKFAERLRRRGRKQKRLDDRKLPGRVYSPPDDYPADFWTRVDAALEDRDREIIRMRFRDGLTQRQAADRLGYSLIWVKVREKAALSELAGRVDFGECVAA